MDWQSGDKGREWNMKIVTAIKVMYHFLKSYQGSKNAVFLSAEDTVNEIMNNRLSLIRYGDGEMNYIMGQNVHYQHNDAELKKYLNDIIVDYINRTDVRYFVAMPGDFLKCKGKDLLKNRGYLVSWSFARDIFNQKYDVHIQYGDAFLFAEENREVLRKIWINAPVSHVILVHNNEEYLGQLKDDCDKQLHFIKIPCKNAFAEFRRILSDIILLINELEKEDALVLISAGPCAKALVYELSKKNIWAIDTGHCFCRPLHIKK